MNPTYRASPVLACNAAQLLYVCQDLVHCILQRGMLALARWQLCLSVCCGTLLVLGASTRLHSDTWLNANLADHKIEALPHTLSTHAPPRTCTRVTTAHTWTSPAA